MIVTEDFTKLAAGIRIPIDGSVTLCPRCGRNGVRRARVDGSIRYVHLQMSQVMADGLRAEAADACTMVEPAGKG